jgi:hypothetical protein
MSDELVQRVAAAIDAVEVIIETDDWVEHFAGTELSNAAQIAIARAIIPLIVEQCAKVADEYAAWHDKHDDGLSGFDKMAEGAREVAETIRNLGSEA